MRDLRLQIYDLTISPAQVSAGTAVEQTFNLPQEAEGGPDVNAPDIVLSVSKPTAQAGLGIVGWRLSAKNQVGITFIATAAGAVTPTAGETYRVVVLRHQPV